MQGWERPRLVGEVRAWRRGIDQHCLDERGHADLDQRRSCYVCIVCVVAEGAVAVGLDSFQEVSGVMAIA